MGLAQFIQKVYNLTISGTTVRVRRYPNLAVGVTLTGSGAAYTYKAASANVKAFVVKATIPSNWRFAGISPFTPSAVATEYFIILGAGAAAAGTLTQALADIEVSLGVITVATGQIPPIMFPYAPTHIADGLTDAALGDLTTTNAAADTLTCGADVMYGHGG